MVPLFLILWPAESHWNYHWELQNGACLNKAEERVKLPASTEFDEYILRVLNLFM